MMDERLAARTGPAYYFCVALARETSNLLVDEIGALRLAVGAALAARPVTVLGWTVLPGRMHAVWRMDWDDDHVGRWLAIQRGFENALRDLGRRVETRLFSDHMHVHRLRDAADLEAHLEVSRNAPVEAGLVPKADHWPYGSFRKPPLSRARPAASLA